MKAPVIVAILLTSAGAGHADSLPSLASGDAKKRMTAFVDAVTDADSADYVPNPTASQYSTTTARSGPSSRPISR